MNHLSLPPSFSFPHLILELVTDWQRSYCGDEITGGAVNQTTTQDCNHPCSSDFWEICGGDWYMSLYANAKNASATEQDHTLPNARNILF